MRLLLVRHAEAAPGSPDELRELTPAGWERARELGLELAAAGTRPDAILTSPLLRARQTADELARALGLAPEVDERLAPGAATDDVRQAATERGKTVLVVGHQPDLGRIAAELGGGEPPGLRPGALVAVDVDGAHD
jgi:phosphohistidine phosphatase